MQFTRRTVWMAGLSLVLVGCNADPSGPVPPGGPPEHLAWGRLLLMALFAAGVLLTAGAAVSVAFRKGGPVAGTLVASLVGMAVVGLCLMASWAVYVDRSEGARRAESQARMRHIGASLHPDLVSSPLTSTRADDFGTADGIGPSGVEATPGTRSEPLPEWVTEGTVRDGDRTRAVVSGQQFADPETALRDALAQAAGLVQWDFDAGLGHARRVDIPTDGHSVSVATGDWGSHSRIDYPGRGPTIDYRNDRWALDPAVVEAYAVRDRHTETIRRTAGENEFTVYRTHLLVELSPEVRRQVEAVWRRQVSAGRSVTVAGLLALLTAIAGVIAGYFRLDGRTGGRYRWRLRLAAAAAAALIVGGLLPATNVAAQAMRSRAADAPPAPAGPPPMVHENLPAELPPPAPMPPRLEPVFDVSAVDCPG